MSKSYAQRMEEQEEQIEEIKSLFALADCIDCNPWAGTHTDDDRCFVHLLEVCIDALSILQTDSCVLSDEDEALGFLGRARECIDLAETRLTGRP